MTRLELDTYRLRLSEQLDAQLATIEARRDPADSSDFALILSNQTLLLRAMVLLLAQPEA
ncbi:MAG TPA: hypothetical protein VFV87_14325 [Pirellulaceae bacterium]|nr:hypothetical protein [Pirellulaceae bacterium]